MSHETSMVPEPDVDLMQLATQAGVPARHVEKAMLVKRLLDGKAADGNKASKGKARLVQHIRSLQSAHEAMQSRLDALAEALGACYCWGEDKNCRGCRGKGIPGALPADPDRFDEFVLPLLLRIGLVAEDEAPDAPPED